MKNHAPQAAVPVWTLLVRVTHWAVAACVAINFFNESGIWHRGVGYACLLILLLRLADGYWLSKSFTSRFYLPSMADIKLHLKELWSGRVSQHAGHNPLGQYAVYVMWLLIILLGFTGWLSRTDAYWGVDWPVDMHAILSATLQMMVIMHLLAVVLMSRFQRRNLVKSMMSGK